MTSSVRGSVLRPREVRVAELYDRFSAAQIGERFGVSADAIRMRMHRARRKCPKLLPTRSPRIGRALCASQIGSQGRPFSLDAI
jgi:hypothetical protein